ncbi:hypothetical protein A8135_08445 [Legionella jamestowniensis]|uniref:23, 7 kDa protein n=1 Tax=Legionella jamestowniensis TaxID=455 RepID=A0ABX2XXA7_9GAMM|nr:hypothetical protein [Legionella jamestowniensis]OCH99263.1 hypothetical protein A8135_08445 [Legionella jamestowniensis]
MLTFFQSKAKKSEDKINILISQSLKHLENQQVILQLITQKQWAFQCQLSHSQNALEKNAILRCYALFAETLLQCIQTPQNINEYIKNYYESSDYCPVGSDDNHAYTLFDEINNTLLKVGLTAFVFSFVTLPFSMPIGLIVLGISLAVMLPTAFYALVETIPNQTKIKKEEKALFTELYSCLNSENVTNSPELEVRVDQPATA